MRLVEGEFPDYRGVVPKESRYAVTVARDALQASIKRAAIFSSERYHGVKLALAKGEMTVSSTSPELGEANETIDADFKGEEFSVGFNSAYLLHALGVLPAGKQCDSWLNRRGQPRGAHDTDRFGIQIRRDADAALKRDAVESKPISAGPA